LVGCPTTTGEENQMTKFEGTWRNPNGNHPAYTFVNDTYTSTDNNSDAILSQGTFTFTDTTITFIPSSGDSWTQDYTLEGNNLTIIRDNAHDYGLFIKNWEQEKTKFEGVWKSGVRAYSFSFDHFEFSDTSQAFSTDGNFIFTDTTITFTPSGGNSWTQDYTLQNDVLILQQPPSNGYAWGNFTKQPE
jgi:hypothetical protein